MKKLLAVINLLLCLTLVGCDSIITEGEVYNKEYRESRIVVTTRPVTHKVGKVISTTLIPVTHYYPESYVIFIKSYDNESEKWIIEDYYVNKETYDSISIGDYFIYDEDNMLQDEPMEEHDS